MSVLVKGMELPKSCAFCGIAIMCYTADGIHNGMIKKDERLLSCPLVEAPTPHGRLIDADALYEKVTGWEAQALQTTMHEEDISERKIWSVILAERSAFKYDVEDAPTVIEADRGME